MAKDFNIAVLMDFYGGLLTEKRYSVLEMYYNQDLSLGEIADELKISRQGVRDSIKHGEKQLLELENKLGLAERFMEIKHYIHKINSIISEREKFEDMQDMKMLLEEINKAL